MSAPTQLVVAPGVSALAPVTGLLPVGLAEVDERAALQHRVDRKHVLAVADLPALLDALPASWRHLRIGDRHATTCSTQYVDTPDLACWRAHAQGRRLRWKARVRTYVEDGLSRFEVKTTDGRDRTVKVGLVLPEPVDEDGAPLPPAALDLLERTLAAMRPAGGPTAVGPLVASTRVACVRATLADPVAGARLTLDAHLLGELDGRTRAARTDLLVVETKGGLARGAADRALARAGARPVSLSKYQLLTAALRGGLPDNGQRELTRLLLGEQHRARGAA